MKRGVDMTGKTGQRALRRTGPWAAVVGLSLLTACFGGGGDDPVTPPVVNQFPESALASPEAYTQFALNLPTSETDQPLNVDNVDPPPTSETAAPVDFD